MLQMASQSSGYKWYGEHWHSYHSRRSRRPESLGASLFFSRGQGDCGHAGRFFISIAAQLARVLPELQSYICETIAEHEDIAQRSLQERWKRLILGPLSRLRNTPSRPSRLVLVINALDACESEDDIQVILQL